MALCRCYLVHDIEKRINLADGAITDRRLRQGMRVRGGGVSVASTCRVYRVIHLARVGFMDGTF